jgi:hypothetical protein
MTTNLLAHRPFASETSIRSLVIAFDFPLPVSETPMWTWRIRPIVRTTVCPFPKHCSFLAHVTALDVFATNWTLIGLCFSFLWTNCWDFTTITMLRVFCNTHLQQRHCIISHRRKCHSNHGRTKHHGEWPHDGQNDWTIEKVPIAFSEP